MEKEKEKKKSGLKERDKQIIIVIVLAVALFLSYRFATVTMAANIDKADKTIVEKTKKRDELKAADARRDEIKKENEKMELDSKDILKKYPTRTSFEKIIEYLVFLFDKYSFGIGNLSYEDQGVFYSFVDEKGKPIPNGGTINTTKLMIEYNCNYRVLRKLINFINNECPTRVKIEKIEVSYDETAGGLIGEVELSVYTGYNIKDYKEPDFGVDIGRDSVFVGNDIFVNKEKQKKK